MRSDDRLRQRRDFQRIYAEGVKVSGRFVVLFACPRAGETSRLGITATRRIGGAVVRNRARRRVRELYRRHQEGLGVQTVDLVVNVRPGCAVAPWLELERDYVKCLTKLVRSLPLRGCS